MASIKATNRTMSDSHKAALAEGRAQGRAVRRYLEFPMPVPAWGAPERVDYVLYAPDGSAYDRGDFDPRTELPLRYMPPLWPGAWRLELTTNDGQRFAGSFELATMAPSRDPIRVAVQPAR